MGYSRDPYRRVDWLQFCKTIGARPTAAMWSFIVGAGNDAAIIEETSTEATAERNKILDDINYKFEVLKKFAALSKEKINELQNKNADFEIKCIALISELEVLKSRI